MPLKNGRLGAKRNTFMNKHIRYFVCDFETTVYDGQTDTEVWAAACVEMYTEDVRVFSSLPDLWLYLVGLKDNLICYFHNLKFDGNFWLDYFLRHEKYHQDYTVLKEEPFIIKWNDNKDMSQRGFKYNISDRGAWYNIVVKMNGKTIEFRDSLKLLPFSVKKIGKDFKTKHQKLDIEYEGVRKAGGRITEHEKEYIANDVLVVKEALEIMFDQGMNRMTIGSCCMAEYKKTVDKEEYKLFFPNLYSFDCPIKGYLSPGEYIRKSYKGGWCYVVDDTVGKIFTDGCTFDVNSLYPYVMHGASGNRYPVGKPVFWQGNFIPDEANKLNRYYFVRIKTRFYLKEGFLPFIQIKGNPLYPGTEMLKSSDIYDTENGYVSEYTVNGKHYDTRVEITFTMTDYVRFLEFYNVVDFEILDGCYFLTEIGLFDQYIDHWKQIKMNSTGAIRVIAKLMSNNLYGKEAASPDSSFKFAALDEKGDIKFMLIEEHEKEPGYIAIGSAITSYARDYTIRTAQANYYGPDQRGFKYADTDSIHCDLLPEEVKNVTEDKAIYGRWKCESEWDTAVFVRQKTYIEHVVKEDHEDVEPYYNVKCAGMPDYCKQLFLMSMSGQTDGEIDGKPVTDVDRKFLEQKRDLLDFKVGLQVPGKLRPKRMRGGIVLERTTYEIR